MVREKKIRDFVFMEDLDLGEKAYMSLWLSNLIDEDLNLSDYGEAVAYITFSPTISNEMELESTYEKRKRKLRLQYRIDPTAALEADAPQFFDLLLNGLIEAVEAFEKPATGFDRAAFARDLRKLRFEQLVPVD